MAPSPADLPFRSALDLLDSGIGFYRSDLSLIFGNEALRRLIEADCRIAAEVEQALGELAVKCRLVGQDGEVKSLLDRRLETEGGTFRIRGGSVGMDLWATGGSMVLTIEPVARESSPQPGEVARRFRLTQREAELAILLADGRSNDDIADQLYLSPHTIRNYTRRVLSKLGVRSRAQVGPRLRSR